ncbi:MAG: ABC transporter substrate-binding protein [Gemmataceae bacterium]|nr:ABC transporter substrate-binding protein [Gemmataceae bacterium]
MTALPEPTPSPRLIRVGHSPDPDDAFMFYALANDKIATGPLRFSHELQDIETLNRRALQGELEVSAVSIHAYAYLAERYALLTCGCSMGDKYGPILVARRRLALRDLPDVTIAVPGTLTTAFLALQLLFESLHARPRLRYRVVPFDQILQTVAAGQCDAGLIIHEGQLTFHNLGLNLIIDLGVWWQDRTGLPLPLGGNVVRKDLGADLMRQINYLVQQSIQYALAHRQEALDYALQFARGMDPQLADRFVSMYVNHWTIDYGQHGRAAIERLLHEAALARILPAPPPLEFVA